MRKTLLVVIVLLIVSACSQAQSPVVRAGTDFGAQPDPALPALPQIGQPMGPGAGPTPFGTGEQPVLRFAGDNAPQNQFIFSLTDDTGYDDNVFGNDLNRKRDFFTDVGPRITYLTSRKHITFDLDYAPFFQIYKQYSGYDSVNQSLNLNAAAQISPRFELRVREMAGEYYFGLFGGYGQPVVSGLGPPGGTVPYFVNPDTRSISTRSRVDIIFNKSARTTLDVFGDFSTLNYKNLGNAASGTLFNLEAPNGGFSYSYRVNARGTFSATYDYGKSVYLGVHNPPRYQTQTASLSYAYQFSNTMSASVWGGPEYTQLRETLLIPIPPLGFIPVLIDKPEWDWSAGFSVSRTTPLSTIALTASRYVTSGGGLLTAVDDSMGELRFSRRLTLGWTGDAGLTYSQVQALGFGGVMSGHYNIEYGTLGFHHQLGERASLRMSYVGTRQRSGHGTAFNFFGVDRNRASVGIDWQIGKVHLGQ